MKPILFAVMLIAGMACPAPFARAQNAHTEVLQVAQKVLEAIGKGDTAAFRSCFLPTAMIYTVRQKDGQPFPTSRSPFNDTFRPGTVIRERMKDTGVEVQVQDHIAQVWAPYDLWINDSFSHCGVDVFTLIKTPSGWRVASLAYTIEKENCTSTKGEQPDKSRSLEKSP